jgi:tripartite-type tricarboxylate transporter receptor subunit TctC
MGQWLSERSGQQFVIENRPGAGSDIATDVVVRAPPDGYTLLVFGILTAIEKMRSQKRYDPKALVDWYVKLARVRGWPNDTPTSTRNVRTLSRSVPTCRV